MEDIINNKLFKSVYVKPSYILIDGVNDTYTGDINEYKLKDTVLNKQYDDEINEDSEKREELLNYWKSLDQYEQKSKEWLKQRSQYLGGSEAGTLLNLNHYESQYKVILKKLITIPFGSFDAVYHGNKYEDVAVMVYEWLMNIKIDDYGFLPHRTIKFMGASPDGITSSNKYDGTHKTNRNGTMIEIKCPASRKINMKPDADLFDIIPVYYYAQVQQQMETCDLDYTDFWQIKIEEYENYKQYKEDSNPDIPFMNSKYQFKGAVIQILPLKEFSDVLHTTTETTETLLKQEQNAARSLKDALLHPDRKLKQRIYANAKFIQQPHINMSPEEIKQWIIDVKKGTGPDIENDEVKKHYEIREGYFFHCVKYWKLTLGRCKRITRSKEWINKYMDTYKKIWRYVEFLRDEKNNKIKDDFIKICNEVEVQTNTTFKKDWNANERNNNEIMKWLEYKIDNLHDKEEIEEIEFKYLNVDETKEIFHNNDIKIKPDYDNDIGFIIC